MDFEGIIRYEVVNAINCSKSVFVYNDTQRRCILRAFSDVDYRANSDVKQTVLCVLNDNKDVRVDGVVYIKNKPYVVCELMYRHNNVTLCLYVRPIYERDVKRNTTQSRDALS